MKDDAPQDPRFPGGNYLDWLMSLDPLALSAQNIDEIIADHRAKRGIHTSGGKLKRPTEKIDLAAIGLGAKPSAPIKRRKV